MLAVKVIAKADIEEVLQKIYEVAEGGVAIKREDFSKYPTTGGYANMPEIIDKMKADGRVNETEGGIILTEKGRGEAVKIIRCHRLAERLLSDILMLGEPEREKHACEFEHKISEEAAESICTLLGHPKFCPDGNPIPPGKCCGEKRKEIAPLIYTLRELSSGEKGRVVYIEATDYSRVRKLTAFGILPGKDLTVIQKKPSIVFKVDETQLAIDDEITDHIFVKKMQ